MSAISHRPSKCRKPPRKCVSTLTVNPEEKICGTPYCVKCSTNVMSSDGSGAFGTNETLRVIRALHAANTSRNQEITSAGNSVFAMIVLYDHVHREGNSGKSLTNLYPPPYPPSVLHAATPSVYGLHAVGRGFESLIAHHPSFLNEREVPRNSKVVRAPRY